MENIKAKLGAVLAAVLGILYLLFRFERKKRIEAETSLKSAEFDAKDTLLAQKQADVGAKVEEEKARLEEAKKADLTTEQMTDFLNKL